MVARMTKCAVAAIAWVGSAWSAGVLGAVPAAGAPEASAAQRDECVHDEASAQPDLRQGPARFDAGAGSALEVKRVSTGHLLVRPVINGVAAGWFIFDTGAGICVVSTPHAGAFNLTAAGEIRATGVGGEGGKKLWRATRVTLGPLTLEDHPIMETDLSFLKQYLGEEIQGIIGYGVLSACVAEIEIGGGDRPARIALFEPSAYRLTGGAWTDLDVTDRVPAVRAMYAAYADSEPVTALFRIDTGANGTVTFHQPAVEKHGLALGPGVKDSKLGGVGGFIAAKTGAVAWFELGGVRRENLPSSFAMEAKGTFAEADKDGNIGADLLRPFTMVLDYPGKRAAFIPLPK